MSDLISVQEAQQRILANYQPVESTGVAFQDAINRVLAADVVSDAAWPPFDNSSMDGFAVISSDTEFAHPDQPAHLEVIADIPAGTHPEINLKPGQSARIMTGAPVPHGADAVIPIEDTNQDRASVNSDLPNSVQVNKPATPGQFIRPSGQDIAPGQVVLHAGRRIKPADIGLLAMLGEVCPNVYRKPRVALLSTGDELVPPGQALRPGKIRDSNSYMLAALIASAGAEVIQLGFTEDRFENVQSLLNQGVKAGVDLLLTSAGVSVGAFDFVRSVVESRGHLDFWRVNMRPGKPVTVGEYDGIHFIGLPGNPVSAYVGFEVFVRPAINRLAGMLKTERLSLQIATAHEIFSDGRESYLRARIDKLDGEWKATLTGHQGSGNLLSIVDANALLIIPAGVKSLPVGSKVTAWLMNLD